MTKNMVQAIIVLVLAAITGSQGIAQTTPEQPSAEVSAVLKALGKTAAGDASQQKPASTPPAPTTYAGQNASQSTEAATGPSADELYMTALEAAQRASAGFDPNLALKQTQQDLAESATRLQAALASDNGAPAQGSPVSKPESQAGEKNTADKAKPFPAETSGERKDTAPTSPQLPQVTETAVPPVQAPVPPRDGNPDTWKTRKPVPGGTDSPATQPEPAGTQAAVQTSVIPPQVEGETVATQLKNQPEPSNTAMLTTTTEANTPGSLEMLRQQLYKLEQRVVALETPGGGR